MRHLLLLICWLIVLNTSYAQPDEDTYTDIYFTNGCNYAHDHGGGLVTVLNSNAKAERIVAEIAEALPEYRNQARNFTLRVADIDNARATTSGQKRYILFNLQFLANFEQGALTRWAAYSLFAHEIGHHLLDHDLTTTDAKLRKRFELQADEFSGRVLALMGADQQEALAGIKTLTYAGETNTHPAQSAREQAVFQGFFEETERMMIPERSTQSSGENAGAPSITPPTNTKFNLSLDTRSLRNNRWNLVEKAEGVIDGEKIRINYQVPATFRNQPLRIGLLTSDGEVGPEVQLANTISGTGNNQRLDANKGEIIWNYRLEKYSEREVSKEQLLRVVVYREHDLPHAPNIGGWLGAGGTLAVGTGIFLWGVTELAEAQNIYQLYESVRDPADAIYINESRTDRYRRANDHNLRGQWLSYGGGLVLLGGGVWLYDKIRMLKTFQRDYCYSDRGTMLEPLVGSNGIGLRLVF